jgi:Uncharacterized protein conserved in bacteria (DUF2252)
MQFEKSTRLYERWLGRHLEVIEADLKLKHRQMAESVFPFLRATYYRWAALWPEVCRDLASAPVVLAVGDLHVENFGTWRDCEGRLIWGVNDFDEAYELPYTNDLVRLATSALLASDHLTLAAEQACAAILEGYGAAVEQGGEPFVLEAKHAWLRETATSDLRNPVRFWAKLAELEPIERSVPKEVRKALRRALPEPDLAFEVYHRIAGLGSLGRPRYLAVADWRGGKVAREAKALAPSACSFAQGRKRARIRYAEITKRAVRVPDPFIRTDGNWIVRRLAPSCARIELDALAKKRDERHLLRAMGFETANVHLGTKKARRAIVRDLAEQEPMWLFRAASAMVDAVRADWRAWKNR